jgi:hypothetical protein
LLLSAFGLKAETLCLMATPNVDAACRRKLEVPNDQHRFAF